LVVIGGLIGGGVFLYHLKGRVPGMHKEQFQTVDGLNRVMDLTRQRFGDTMGYQLSVGPESFSVMRIDPDNHQKTADYSWYSWRGHFEDPSVIEDLKDLPSWYGRDPVDLSKFDTQAVVKVLQDAPNTLHIESTAVKSRFLSIQSTEDSPGAVEVEVSLDTSKGRGSIFTGPDGTVKKTTSDWT
jgi:hypothetical protein